MTLMEIIREEFEKVINTKNSWGKNELLVEYDKACIRGMIKFAKQEGFTLT